MAVQLAVTTLREAPTAAWSGKAGSLEWDCWETVEHLSDALFSYAVQLGPRTPPADLCARVLARLPAAVLVMQRGVIEREERYLERRFGAEYNPYKARVRRWL